VDVHRRNCNASELAHESEGWWRATHTSTSTRKRMRPYSEKMERRAEVLAPYRPSSGEIAVRSLNAGASSCVAFRFSRAGFDRRRRGAAVFGMRAAVQADVNDR
jgi:hypothetical protein